MAKDGRKANGGDLSRTYPLIGKRYIFRTMACRIDERDVAANQKAVAALFDQFRIALNVFLHLLPVRAPYRDAFRKDDMVAAKKAAPGLTPGQRSAALDKAIEMWRSFERRGGPEGAPGVGMPGSSIPKDEASLPVRLQKKEYSLVLDPAGPARVSVCTPEGNVELRLMGGSHQAPLLMDIVRGEGGLVRCIGELVRRPSGLSIDIHYGKPVPGAVQDLPFGRKAAAYVPIGVDLGIHNLIVAATPGRGSKGVLFVPGGPWREGLRRFGRAQRLHNDLGRKDAWAASKRAEGCFFRDMAHKAALRLIGLAGSIAGGEVPLLVLEDLVFEDITRKGGSRDGPRLSREVAAELGRWPYGLLRDIIIEKASWEGIPVMVVPPAGTGLTCPKCGSTDAVRRRDVHRLVCPDCAYRANDDYCSALNIARRGLKTLLRDRETVLGEVHHHHADRLCEAMRPADRGAAGASLGSAGADAGTCLDQGAAGGPAYFGGSDAPRQRCQGLPREPWTEKRY